MTADYSTERWRSLKFFNLALQDRLWRLWFAQKTEAPDFLSILAGFGEAEDDSCRQAVAENSATSAEVLELLASDRDKFVRAKVAANPSTPAGVLATLAEDVEHWVHGAAAANPSTPESVLKVLHRSESYPARAGVAGNPGLTPEFLEALINDDAPDLRSALSQNPLISFELRQTFSESDDPMVAGGVAKNPKVTPAELITLSKHQSEYVRLSVARNTRAPVEALEALASDSQVAVRKAVARNRSTPASILEILSQDEEDVRAEVSSNPNSPETVLRSLLAEGYDLGIAGNSKAPAELLRKLAPEPRADGAEWVRRVLAENPSTPVDVLTALGEGTDNLVFRNIFGNPSTPDSLAELAINKAIGLILISRGETLVKSTAEAPQEQPVYYADCPTSVQTMIEIIGMEINNPKYGMLLIQNADEEDSEEYAAYIAIDDKPVQEYSEDELFVVWDMFTHICDLLGVNADTAFESYEDFKAVKNSR